MNTLLIRSGRACLILSFTAFLVAGCGEDAPQTSETQKAAEAVGTAEQSEESGSPVSGALEKAGSNLEQAGANLGEAASALAEQTGETVKKAATVVEQKVEETIAPVIAAATAPDGEKVYKGVCFTCHDNGVAGAPKPGDAAAWVERLAQGMEGLYATAINGRGAMPPRGGNPNLSDAEVKAAVDYMVAQSK